MTTGTITSVIEHGSIITVEITNQDTHEVAVVHGDARPVSYFLDAVLAEAEESGLHPTEVVVTAYQDEDGEARLMLGAMTPDEDLALV